MNTMNLRVQKNGIFNKLGKKQLIEQLEYENNKFFEDQFNIYNYNNDTKDNNKR